MQLCGVALGAGPVWSLESAVGEELERAEEKLRRSLESAVGGGAEESGGDGTWERSQASRAAQSCAFVYRTWGEQERARQPAPDGRR